MGGYGFYVWEAAPTSVVMLAKWRIRLQRKALLPSIRITRPNTEHHETSSKRTALIVGGLANQSATVLNAFPEQSGVLSLVKSPPEAPSMCFELWRDGARRIRQTQ
jgi:heme exporter protein D